MCGGGICGSARWRWASATRRVSLLYERVLRKEKQLDLWVERCKSQISGVLEMLEKERAAVKTPYWFGESIGHADIAVACVLRFTGEAHPALFDARYPALKAHSAALRGAAAVPGNRAAAGAAEGVSELGGVGHDRGAFSSCRSRCARTCVSRRPNPTLHGVVFAIFAGRVRRVRKSRRRAASLAFRPSAASPPACPAAPADAPWQTPAAPSRSQRCASRSARSQDRSAA